MIIVIQKYEWERDDNFSYPAKEFYATSDEEADFLIEKAIEIEGRQEEFNYDIGESAGFYPQYIKHEIQRFSDYLSIKM